MDGICLCPHIHCVPGPYSPKAIANGNHRHFSGYNLSQVEAGYTEACLFMEKTQWDHRLGDKGPSLPGDCQGTLVFGPLCHHPHSFPLYLFCLDTSFGAFGLL